MISIFNDMNPAMRRLVRLGYLVLIVALGGYAAITYRQLQALRSVPVVLPNYGFYIVDIPVKAALVQARGSWVGSGGPTAAGTLQTTTLECNRSKMLCVDSTATVAVKEGSYMEATPTLYEVEQWTDQEVVTKALARDCAQYLLRVRLADRSATTEVSLLPGQVSCKDPPRKLRLDSGIKSR